LIVGKTSWISPVLLASRAADGVNQPRSTHSSPSTRGSWRGGSSARKKCVSKRIWTSAGVIQRENLTSAAGSSRTIRDAVRLVAVALAGVDGAAGKHPHAPHEAGVRRALDEQHLQILRAPAQQDHACRLARKRGGSGVVRLARPRALALLRRAHLLTLPAANLSRMSDITASSPDGEATRA
jgi:hypothetical protein